MIKEETMSEQITIIGKSKLNPTAVIDSPYGMIRQDPAINALSRISSRTGAEMDPFLGTGLIRTKNGNTDIQVLIAEYGNVQLKQSTSKLERLLTICFTEAGSNCSTVSISLKDAMYALGLKNKQKARTTIKKDLEALYNITLKVIKNHSSKKQDYLEFRICDVWCIKNGIISMNFSAPIFKHLQNCPVMPYPKELLRIESNQQKNPYSFYIGDKITELAKLNQHDNNTQKLKEYFIVSVNNLLKLCMSNGMPTYEEVMTSDRAVSRKIVEPLEKNLNALENIFSWEYCHAKGLPLTDDELEADISYKEYTQRYIKVIMGNNYPHEEWDKKKAERKKKNIKRANKIK